MSYCVLLPFTQQLQHPHSASSPSKSPFIFQGELERGRVAGRDSSSDTAIGKGREAKEVEGGDMRQRRRTSSLQHERAHTQQRRGHVRLRLWLNLAPQMKEGGKRSGRI